MTTQTMTLMTILSPMMSDPLGIMVRTVLSFEALVVLFALLVARTTGASGSVVALGVGLSVGCVVIAGMWGRARRFSLAAGSVAQVALIGCGVVVTSMYVLGGIFALLWVVALFAGRRVAAQTAARSGLSATAD